MDMYHARESPGGFSEFHLYMLHMNKEEVWCGGGGGGGGCQQEGGGIGTCIKL
jgi:hypothetical protein